ncbi:MAG: hypothetical protein M9884_17360 [Rhodocyclaceae bacterium]|nr:hypothetical protein [Rhodocyclaceae bacterium]
MTTDTTEAPARRVAAVDAWAEIQSIMCVLKEADCELDPNFIRSMAVRCYDLSEVMAQAFSSWVLSVDDAWRILYGHGYENKLAAFRHQELEDETPA